MNLARREKYSSKKKSKVREQFIMSFDLQSLNLFCSYILSENRNIRKSHLINMRNLFSVIHEDSFKNDEEKLKRVDFIKKGLTARVFNNFKDPFMILKAINGGLIEEDLLDIKNFSEVSNEELVWINETVSACIKNSFVNTYMDDIVEIYSRYRAADYRMRTPIVYEFEMAINAMQARFRRAKAETSNEEMFSLKNGRFEDVVGAVHNDLCNPGNKLLTGMQGFNEMLSGGFENGRAYMLFGLPGEGKSMSLLDLAYQIKRYNKSYKPKDPTKIPCIIFLTMENTIRDSVERLFNMSTTTENITNFTLEQVLHKMKTDGELYLSDESPVDIIIKFVPNGSVDTSYLYTLTEDLEDEGYECICMVQDYIKRIRPVDFTGELRIDLGNVLNDFKTFASVKDIPVISASQLNRDATKHIDEGRKANKADLVRLLGRGNIGESMLILENADGAFMIAPEYDADGNKYMGIQRIKARYKTTMRTHIYQPYLKDNAIKLEEDEGYVQVAYKDSLRTNKEALAGAFNNNSTVSAYHSNSIKSIDDVKLLHSDSDNIYINATSRFKQEVPTYQAPTLRSAIYRGTNNLEDRNHMVKATYKAS